MFNGWILPQWLLQSHSSNAVFTESRLQLWRKHGRWRQHNKTVIQCCAKRQTWEENCVRKSSTTYLSSVSSTRHVASVARVFVFITTIRGPTEALVSTLNTDIWTSFLHSITHITKRRISVSVIFNQMYFVSTVKVSSANRFLPQYNLIVRWFRTRSHLLGA